MGIRGLNNHRNYIRDSVDQIREDDDGGGGHFQTRCLVNHSGWKFTQRPPVYSIHIYMYYIIILWGFFFTRKAVSLDFFMCRLFLTVAAASSYSHHYYCNDGKSSTPNCRAHSVQYCLYRIMSKAFLIFNRSPIIMSLLKILCRRRYKCPEITNVPNIVCW